MNIYWIILLIFTFKGCLNLCLIKLLPLEKGYISQILYIRIL